MWTVFVIGLVFLLGWLVGMVVALTVNDDFNRRHHYAAGFDSGYQKGWEDKALGNRKYVEFE